MNLNSMDPVDVKTMIVIGIGLYPFLMGGIAAWINHHNICATNIRRFAIFGGIIGVTFSITFLTLVRISKYPITDFLFGIVFVLAFIATFAMIGSVVDRFSSSAANKSSSN